MEFFVGKMTDIFPNSERCENIKNVVLQNSAILEK